MALTNDFKVKNGLTVTDSISAGSCIEADSFEKHGGTSSQFLKADGSVDSSAYTTCCGDVTGIDAGTAITVTDGNTATPQVAVNSTCNSTWNAKTTCTGTVTNVVGCDGITVNNGTGSACVCVDSTVVRTTGSQSIGGAKCFTDNVRVAANIYHTGDTDTRINFNTNSIKIEAGGESQLVLNTSEVVINDLGASNDFRVEGDTDTHALFVDGSADKVGIGTANPSKKLHVAGDGLFTSGLTVQGDLTVTGDFTCLETTVSLTSAMDITNTGTGPALVVNQTGSNDIVNFQDDGASAFYIEDGGFVGLNCTNPVQRLDVNGNVNTSGDYRIDTAIVVNSGRCFVGTQVRPTTAIADAYIASAACWNACATSTQGTKADNALPKAGGTMSGAIAMGNSNITGVNTFCFADPGPTEGIHWTGGNTKIVESPDNLSTNSAGNLQMVYGTTRRLTVNNTGIDVNGNIVVSGTVDGVDVAALATCPGLNATGTVCTLSNLGITSTAAEINKLDGFTGTCADLNYAKDLRATGVTTTEFNCLDGLTATTTELNYSDGVTSNIQNQLNAKQASGTYNTIIGTDSDINTSGCTVIDQLNMTDGVITSHTTRTLTNVGATDDRDMKPCSSGIGCSFRAIKPFFSSLEGMTGSAGTNYQDVLVLDTYSDASGGSANALTFDKSAGAYVIKHWNAAQNATSWGTACTIAYTSCIPTNNNQLTNGCSYGKITCVCGGTNLTGSGSSGTVTINMATGGAGAGTYGSTSNSCKIDSITLDAYGRVTAVACGATCIGDITGVTAGSGLGGGGTSGAVTLCHSDTSSQASVNNSNGTVIQDVTLDTYGHVTALGSANLDSRYYTESEVDTLLAAKQAAGTYNTIIGTDSDINTSGATVVDQLNMTDGVIQSHSTRTLTLANLCYTGATNANYITNNNQLTNGAGYTTCTGNIIGNATNSLFLKLTENPANTTYGCGCSSSPNYYFGQNAGGSDAMKIYAESAAGNDITAIWEINDDLETGKTWVFRNKQTYSPYNAIEAMAIDGNGDVTVGGDLTVSGGDVVLGGTGRIQGIDTVSASTDAANKNYVDTCIAAVPTGDITQVVAGTNLTGGGTSGCVTLNMATGGAGSGTYGCTSNNKKIDTITLDAYGRVTAVAVGSTCDGDITGVTAGTGMTGGGTSGAVTLNVIGGDGITANADNIVVDSTVVRTTGAQTIAGVKTYSSRGDFSNADGVRTNQLRTYGGQQLVLNAGESSSYATGQTAECVFINAEAGLEINSSPDNWSSGWAGRRTSYINNTSGNSHFYGSITLGGNVDGRNVANDGAKLDGIACGATSCTGTGDITAVTAGNGLTGGASSGAATLNVGAGTAITVAADTVGVNSTCNSTWNAKTTCTGTVTSITVNTAAGLDGAGTITSSGTINLSLDLSELTDMTGGICTTQDELILLDNGAERRKLFSEIFGCNAYSNTAFTTCTGDITSVTAGNGLTGGASSGGATLNVGAGTAITVAADTVSVNSTCNSTWNAKTTCLGTTTPSNTQTFTNKSGCISQWTNNSGYTTCTGTGDITAVVAGTNLNGGATSGSATVNLDANISITSATIGSGVTLSESSDRADLLYVNSSTSSWGGLQIGNTSNEFIFSLMGNGSQGGIYDDQQNEWLILWTENGGVNLYHNSSSKLCTTSTGVNVGGNITVTGTVDGRDVAADGSKLDGIACGATSCTGDITAVTAGNGLTGGASSGSATLNVGAGTAITVAADTVSVNSTCNSTWNGKTTCTGTTTPSNTQTFTNKSGCISQWTNNSGYITSSGSITGNAATATSATNSTCAGGLVVGTGRNNSANQIVRTNASGYAEFGWINTTSGNTTSTITDFYVNTNDGYIRKATNSHVRSQLNVANGATACTGTTTASNSQTFTNKTGCISQWINNSGYTTCTGNVVTSGSTFTGSVTLNDNVCLRLGSSADLSLYHNATSSYIDNDKNHLCIRNNVDGDDGGNIYIMPHDNENGIIINDDGGVCLYSDNAVKLCTQSYGAKTQGTHCSSYDMKAPIGCFCTMGIGGQSRQSSYALVAGNCASCCGGGSAKFCGTVQVCGSFSKSSGCFDIAHPLPALSATKRLSHSFVESPQADNIYSGVVQLTGGSATVNVDVIHGMTSGTLTALNRCFRTFTTNETNWDPVRGSITDNTLTIESCVADSTATVSWMVLGERHDPHMREIPTTDDEGRARVEYTPPSDIYSDGDWEEL